MKKKIKIIAVIPARSGSKEIKNKNLKKINDKSLIKHAIETAIKSKIFYKIVLSSDSNLYKKEIKNLKNVNFVLRKKNISNDHSNSLSAWRDAILKIEKKEKILFDSSFLLEPTNPTRIIKDIKIVHDKMYKQKYNSVLTISKTPGSFTKHKSLIIKNNKIDHLRKDGHKFTIRQKIPIQYHRNGICYAAKIDYLMNCKNNFISDKTGYIIIDRLNINIDTYSDLKIAKLIMQKNK